MAKTYTPSREATTVREAIKIAFEDGAAEAKRQAAGRAVRPIAEAVRAERRAFGLARVVSFFLGTGLFVATGLFVLTLGVWTWLVWAWVFVFWMRWQVKTQAVASAKKKEWAERLALPKPF
jgi:hypothetical protein